MAQPTKYQYVKLGMNLEYLRGISSASVALTSSLKQFPDLAENLPSRRFEVAKVVPVLRSLLIQLEDMQLEDALAAAAEFRPLLTAIEAFVNQNPEAGAIVLQDGFADKLVRVAKQVSLVLKQELSSQSS